MKKRRRKVACRRLPQRTHTPTEKQASKSVSQSWTHRHVRAASRREVASRSRSVSVGAASRREGEG